MAALWPAYQRPNPRPLLHVDQSLQLAPRSVRVAMEGVIQRCGGLDATTGTVIWPVLLAAPCEQGATGRMIKSYAYEGREHVLLDDGKRWMWWDGSLLPPLRADIDSTWEVDVRKLLHMAVSKDGEHLGGMVRLFGPKRIGSGKARGWRMTTCGELLNVSLPVGFPDVPQGMCGCPCCSDMEGGKSLSVAALFAVAEHGAWCAVEAPDPWEDEYGINKEHGYAYVGRDDGSWPTELVATFPFGQVKHAREVYADRRR